MGPIGSIFTPLASIATIDKEPQKEKEKEKKKIEIESSSC
jgi:hypothetical protein